MYLLLLFFVSCCSHAIDTKKNGLGSATNILKLENGFQYLPLISVEFSSQKMAYVIIST